MDSTIRSQQSPLSHCAPRPRKITRAPALCSAMHPILRLEQLSVSVDPPPPGAVSVARKKKSVHGSFGAAKEEHGGAWGTKRPTGAGGVSRALRKAIGAGWGKRCGAVTVGCKCRLAKGRELLGRRLRPRKWGGGGEVGGHEGAHNAGGQFQFSRVGLARFGSGELRTQSPEALAVGPERRGSWVGWVTQARIAGSRVCARGPHGLGGTLLCSNPLR